ncbi:MAG: hypothetical protein N3A58_08825 [Spirochaetes bacterium]|nr:hypothetical protein [Spirochaetota bacterium]
MNELKEKVKNLFSWIKLDNAAKIYPSITNTKNTNFFRVSVYLKEPVNISILEETLNYVFPRFPYFQVYLKKGLFWFYFEKTDKIPQLLCEQTYPCRSLKIFNDNLLVKIIPYKNRISVESTHILTDGYGILTFLKALTGCYLHFKYGEDFDFEDLITPKKKINEEEYEDAFQRFKNIKTAKVPKKIRAFKVDCDANKNNEYFIVRLEISIEEISKVTKNLGVTINDFIVASMIEAYQRYYINDSKLWKRNKKQPITVVVPVNLRKHFGVNTLRNFSYILDPSIDMNLGIFTFDEILNNVHHFMKLYNTPKNILPYLKRNIISEKKFIIKIIPLFIKDFILKLSYDAIGSKPVSTSVSNIGIIKMPEKMNKYIDSFDFIPSPSYTLKYLTGVIGFQDKLIINIGKVCKCTKIERYFIENFIKNNIKVKVKTNF